MIIITRKDQVVTRRDWRRSQLLEIAVERFAKYGYQNTKISDIVNQAGVAQGTFYWYFKSKEMIALEIIQSGRERLLEVIRKGYRSEGGSVQDMVQGSQRLLADIFRFAQENKDFMELLLRGTGEEEAIRNAFRDTRIEMEEAFRSNIERAVELGMLPASLDLDMRAALLMSLIEGTVARWLFGPNPSNSKLNERSVEEMAAETVRFEFFGLLGI
ncbi:TetR family transcriptional regulator [Paenibacillus selenitireducens]|uniref:TetR family transcriptional regulator n=1 Tax=Paenibacillus selenitireducens TaxID=1324314 RepID=A0A1T2XHJ8_9BACL|nr:TetR/AcrR family transcriptional regulator [Paenibacillus selenitireducens]OPA79143.1 TetR family transcriptional regulator [Paenibacillus selenitireducens]